MNPRRESVAVACLIGGGHAYYFGLQMGWGTMRLVVASLASLCVALTGCQTAGHKLPLEQIADLRVGEVVVSIADGAQISEEVRNVVAPKVKAAVERQFAQRFKGSTPVRIEVTVKRVVVTSAVQRVVIGGPQSMTVDMIMVDPRTRSVLLSYPDRTAQMGVRGGVMEVALEGAISGNDPIDFMAQNLAFQFAEFVRPSEPRS